MIQLDPSGCSYTPAPIPAISHGGMVIFILLLAGSAVWILRRKRQGQEVS